MPTVKCSQCGNEVEISLMGEHICQAASKPELPPQATAPDVITGAFSSLKQTVWGFGSRAAPPSVDTSAANEAFARPDQLTPVSASTGSRTISPKTPSGRLEGGSNGDYFSPTIADVASPGQNGRSGGYGGFGEPQQYEPEPLYYGAKPRNQPQQPQAAPSLLQRMNTIAPGPFELNRRPGGKNAFAPKTEPALKNEPALSQSTYAEDAVNNGYGIERPSTAASYASNGSGGMAPPRVPRKNGYGGFGPPEQDQNDDFEPRPLATTQRSETFPKQAQNRYEDMPARPPSAPGLRQDLTPRPTNENADRLVVSRDREPRPSVVRDTSRAPPPRNKSLMRPGRNPSVNLADEFGAGNPYHTPSGSQSSSNSGYSTSQPSQASSSSSPARSMGSRRQPSNTSNFDALMNDLQSSMQSMKPDFSASQPPAMERSVPSMERRARPEDLRFDPAVQGGPRGPRPRSPLASPPESYSDRIDPAIQGGRSRSPAPAHTRQPSMSRSRGNCKACRIPITGKSISSADGRLTGRYHKACFVCTTCTSPFTSAEFYVLNDKPYDAQCYHRLNGSLCTTCGVGIEGQYLEDESAHKHHPGCFCCADCRRPLQDGYFEVNGKAYCERDAWRRLQQQQQQQQKQQQQSVMAPPSTRGGMRPQYDNGRLGVPGSNRLAPSGLAPPGMPRMEKRITRLGMFM
ncbi:hypothetical protein BKA67DRAFT_692130 [Truncatella angustata]|uniref:LIM zinc-binding domain-containing protein n=1 Tax=Truncatella angustata TaxID=152316 RepID=A0A9P8UIP9_9PEZI|nr:uncharacterized protein BKA67DRAFT_692130 [Truncatella angustata]KAH6652829.1 hypothetical protein BKA67DRAFT_692130 [Truncatella angustata]